MFDESFRALVARPLRPLARILLRAAVTANHVSVAAFVLAAGAAALVAGGAPHAGLALWFVSRLGDGLDGVLAREGGQSSAFGGFLDITLDMAAYSAMILGFATLHPELMFAWIAVLAGYVIVITTTLALSNAATLVARRVSGTNRTFQFTPGLAEAGETTAMYTAWIVLPSEVWWLVWIWVGALVATAMQRCYLAWRLLR